MTCSYLVLRQQFPSIPNDTIKEGANFLHSTTKLANLLACRNDELPCAGPVLLQLSNTLSVMVSFVDLLTNLHTIVHGGSVLTRLLSAVVPLCGRPYPSLQTYSEEWESVETASGQHLFVCCFQDSFICTATDL